MNRIFRIALLGLFSAFSLVSCGGSDNQKVVPIVPYATQYPIDIANIDKFLDEYHMDVSGSDDVTFTKIPTPNTANLTTIRAQFITPYPITDRTKIVNRDGIDYKLYYIPFDPGTVNNPTTVDSVLVSYKGDYLYNKTDEATPSVSYIANASFEQAPNPVWFPLSSVVAGWQQIIPFFKSGSYVANGDGTISYSGFGSGIMFLPSAFGYYSQTVGTIPRYSPLIFSFKLMGLNYVDNDFDGIDSKDEDVNGNGILTDDDTDGDGHPNYLDQDDDGDGFLTKYETQYVNPLDPQALVHHYPYSGAAIDDPSTLYIDETKGVPDCGNNFTLPTRVRKYLDKNCH